MQCLRAKRSQLSANARPGPSRLAFSPSSDLASMQTSTQTSPIREQKKLQREINELHSMQPRKSFRAARARYTRGTCYVRPRLFLLSALSFWRRLMGPFSAARKSKIRRMRDRGVSEEIPHPVIFFPLPSIRFFLPRFCLPATAKRTHVYLESHERTTSRRFYPRRQHIRCGGLEPARHQ